MKPLVVLLASFLLAIIAIKLVKSQYDFALSARIAMAIMLCFTAIGHFVYTKGMSMMLPDFVPFRIELVYLTGVIEVAAAIGLFIPYLRVITAWLLIVFFIMMLPANIYASIKHIDFQKGTFDGHGPSYLWFRVPLQLLFIVWTYLSAIKN